MDRFEWLVKKARARRKRSRENPEPLRLNAGDYSFWRAKLEAPTITAAMLEHTWADLVARADEPVAAPVLPDWLQRMLDEAKAPRRPTLTLVRGDE